MTQGRWYATFGVQYRREPHPTLMPEIADPEGVIEILAPTYNVARSLIVGLTLADDGGTPVAHFSDLYAWPDESDPVELDRFRRFYPRGAVARITFEPRMERIA